MWRLSVGGALAAVGVFSDAASALSATEPDAGAKGAAASGGGTGGTGGAKAAAVDDGLGEAPSPAGTMRAFVDCERALRNWEKLSEEEAGAGVTAADDRVYAPPALNVLVEIRQDGRVIGRGASLTLEGAATPAQSRVRVARAFNRALREAETILRLPNDALREQIGREMARGLTLSVECGGAAIPIQSKTWESLGLEVNPGAMGLIAYVPAGGLGGAGGTIDERRLRGVFASETTALGLTPARALSGVIAEVLGEGGAAAAVDPLEKIMGERGVRVLRFTSTHVAQSTPGGAPVFLTRGARLITSYEFSGTDLVNMATAAAEHLLSRFEHRPEGCPDGVVSIIRPWTSEAGECTGPGETLGTLAALCRAMETKSLPPGVRERARGVVRGELERIGKARSGERDYFTDGVSASMWLLVHARVQRDAKARGEALAIPERPTEAARQYLAQAYTVDGGFRGVPPTAEGLVALALAEDSEFSGDAAQRARAIGATRRALGDAGEAGLVARMPWLGLAAVELAGGSGGESSEKQAADPEVAKVLGAVALRRMRDRVWEHQYNALDATTGSLDMVGGIVFVSGGATPLPTWQSARPVCFLARALRERALTDDGERLAELSRLLKATRFLRQLQVDEAGTWATVQPRLAVGGLSAATWDHSISVEASALGLMTFCEVIDSVEALGRAMSGAKPAGGEKSGTGSSVGTPK
ncbi:MAG TPA: hypothetical protein PL072_11795 [Phycisphaerales bacterium]|nr:hypothetical protein [Phycisphaerales bacterium]